MEIRDLLAYIRLSINQNDNLALERVINVPRRSIGNVTLKKVKDYAEENELSIFSSIEKMLTEDIFKGKAQENLQNFVDVIHAASERYKTEAPLKVTKYLYEISGYQAMLKADKTEESRSRAENIGEMFRAINEFDNIAEFIEHSSLVMDNDMLKEDFGGQVKMMTLHSAKGLEFDLVFLPGMEEGIFPHQKALSEEGAKGLEEERRIAYVGITRAKKELYLTYAERRRVYAEIVNAVPSRFLKEIPNSCSTKNSSSNNLNYLGSRHNFSFETNKKNKPELNTGAMSPGSKVQHEKFGSGIIVKKMGDSLEIVFENIGMKTIKQDYVREVVK
jgi:DNA helicase-2/ATP-dependent DNA helicase PcrA